MSYGTAGGSAWMTTGQGVRSGEPVWAEIAHYLEPVTRFIQYRYPSVSAADRDDLAQAVLLDMHQRLIAGYDSERGRFRTYLKVAIKSRVTDWLRARRRRAATGASELLPEVEARPVADAEAGALDLEAELLRAVRRFHDRFALGAGARDTERQSVQCLGYRVVEGLGEREIGLRLGLTRDQVKERLRRARVEVLRELSGALLARAAPGGPAGPAARDRVADLVRRGVHQPKRVLQILEAEPEPAVRAATEDLLGAIGDARLHFVGLETAAGKEFLRALEDVFQDDERASGTDAC